MITSPANPRLRLVRRLESRRQRAKLGLFVCEGEDLVDAALAEGIEPVDLLVAGEDVEPELLAGVSTLAHPSRVIGVFRRADLRAYEPRSATLALWHVADPGNSGTLIRTADAFGASVALSAGCADPTGPKALRASAGAIFRVPLGEFDEASGRRIALVARGGEPLAAVELGEKTVFVLGAEREGLPEDVVSACDAVASIATTERSESLNVAVAGAIALYEATRRRA
ncbi:MAG TPA: RNA methyltransferase [Gaiellaceae bacterium]|nr:RNA methyltransferase [Gaiellaceae bacterium]